MIGKKANVSGKFILNVGGAIIIFIGVLMLMFGFLNNVPKYVEVGAIMFLVGGATMFLAKKLG